MSKFIKSILFTATILASCTNPKQEKISSLKDEAIKIHDQVMPRMGEIHEVSVEIKTLRNAIKEDTSLASLQATEQLSHYILGLEQADEAMMSWMHEYQIDYEKNNEADSAITYYSDQVARIKQVKLLMDESIDNAKKYVDSFEK